MNQRKPSDPDAAPMVTDEMLRAFILGKLDDHLVDHVGRYLELNPDALERIGPIQPDTFIRNIGQALANPREPRDEFPSRIDKSSLETPADKAISASEQTPSTRDNDDSGNRSIIDVHVGPAAASRLSVPPELAACKQYRIIKELGAGGMGVVYQAENLDMGRRLEAIKVVNDVRLRQPQYRERFEQEIKAVAVLNHPNIVTAYSV
jgi:hypothetical protein